MVRAEDREVGSHCLPGASRWGQVLDTHVYPFSDTVAIITVAAIYGLSRRKKRDLGPCREKEREELFSCDEL